MTFALENQTQRLKTNLARNMLVQNIVILFTFLAVVANGAVVNVDLVSFSPGSLTGWVGDGMTHENHLGAVYKPAGDFNGDGQPDALLGGPASNWGGTAFVLFGSNTFSSTLVVNANLGSTGVQIYSPRTGDRCGQFADGGGDFNGDGFDDVVMGCVGGERGGFYNQGSAWVVFGHSNPAALIDVTALSVTGSQGFLVNGLTWYAHLGRCAFVGDMNGDGLDDIVLGAPHYQNNDFGWVYVLFGTRTLRHIINVASFDFDGIVGFKIKANLGDDRFGMAVSSAGDMNNDGYADMAIQATHVDFNGRSNTGAVYVVFGHSNATAFETNFNIDALPSTNTQGFRVYGYQAGLSHSPGDINGDGFSDLVLNTGTSVAGTNRGTTFVIFGHAGGFANIDLVTFTFNSSVGYTITGASDNDYTGGFFAGDVNNDGYDDLILSSTQVTTAGRTNAGAAYVLFSHGPDTAYVSIALSSFATGEVTGYMIYGPTANQAQWWVSVGKVGDINGDGADDIGFGLPLTNTRGFTDNGKAWVLLSLSRLPTALPTVVPTVNPTNPTSQPSSQPSTQPSTQPSSSHLQLVLSSPTYMERNGFAFAAISAEGKVYTWGEAPYGGDSSAMQLALSTNVTRVVGSRFAYVALQKNGSIAAVWGVASTSTLTQSGPAALSATSLVANEVAFAGVEVNTGRLIALGSKHHGGNVLDDAYCNGYSQELSEGVRSITASAGAFAGLKTDGSVYVWGNKFAGADVSQEFLSSLVGTKMVVATRSAFAALLPDNRVATWGDPISGGDSAAVAGQLEEVFHLTASRSCFVAFKKDTSVVVWGYDKYGGDTSAVAAALSANVVFVAHTFTAMVALKAGGSLVGWGRSENGGTVPGGVENVVRVVGNSRAFAALTATGGVQVWGRAAYGGSIPGDKVVALSSGVVAIYHTDRAFAALKDDGSLVVWGQAGHGGSPSPAVEALLTSGVHTVCANDVAFSAIKTDGSVVAWGHDVSVPVDGSQFSAAGLIGEVTCA